MPRRCRVTIPLHTCNFSPMQMHPTSALEMQMIALSATIDNQIGDWRVMITEHNWSVVVVGFKIEWLQPFTFFDNPSIDINCGIIARRGGELLELDCLLESKGQPVLSLVSLWRPVYTTSGSEALDGTPGRMTDELMARFQADEIDTTKPARVVPGLVAEVKEKGELIGTHERDVWVSRDQCEMADQWSNVVLAGWASHSRDAMVFKGGDARLRQGLVRPLTQVVGELGRPIFLGGDGQVKTEAYALPDRLMYVHQIMGTAPGPDAPRPLCSTIVERIDLQENSST